MVARSDNTGVEICFRLGGGAPSPGGRLRQWRIEGIRIDRGEEQISLDAVEAHYPAREQWTGAMPGYSVRSGLRFRVGPDVRVPMVPDAFANRVRNDSCPIERRFQRSHAPAFFPDGHEIDLAFELDVLKACRNVLAPKLMAFMTLWFGLRFLAAGVRPGFRIPTESLRKK